MELAQECQGISPYKAYNRYEVWLLLFLCRKCTKDFSHFQTFQVKCPCLSLMTFHFGCFSIPSAIMKMHLPDCLLCLVIYKLLSPSTMLRTVLHSPKMVLEFAPKKKRWCSSTSHFYSKKQPFPFSFLSHCTLFNILGFRNSIIL